MAKKAVIRIDMETKEKVRYESAKEAADATFCSDTAVSYYCNGKSKGLFDDKYRFIWAGDE